MSAGVLVLALQDCLWYSVPVNEGMYLLEGLPSYFWTAAPMKVSAVPSQVGENSFSETIIW